jgi:mRNA interferase MazF
LIAATLRRGSIVLVQLDPTVGHEQRGTRPCIVVSSSDVIDAQRFPLIAVVPLTTTAGVGVLYPPLSPGTEGLNRGSYAMIDQVRTIDKRRIYRVFGTIRTEELEAIDEGLRLFLGLS